MLGRCTACFKWKKNTTYCRIKKGHQGERAAPCSDCFEKGVSTSDCRLTHGHCGPGVAATVEKEMTDELPKCIIVLSSVTVPIHLGSHWATVIIDLTTRRISYYDSIPPTSSPCLNRLRLVTTTVVRFQGRFSALKAAGMYDINTVK